MSVEVEQIDRTRDTGDPVFRAESDVAEMTFILPSTRDHDMIIHTVRSDEPGGMSGLLDHLCHEYDCEYILFSTPLSKQLDRKLDGFERKSEIIEDGLMAGSKWEYLEGHWDVR